MPAVIALDDARRHVFDRCAPIEPRRMSLAAAVGAVLAEPVEAPEDVPPFANTAVDGYAVRAADVVAAPCTLEVVGEIAAGAVGDRILGAGEAIRIMTGAPVPDGADAIVMVEDTELSADRSTVTVRRAVAAGDAVRPAGDDIRRGQRVFGAGELITPAVAGVLASVNAVDVAVRRARVAVLSTGDELVDDGSPLGPGQIRESNKTMLLAALHEAGCEPVDLGVVRDDEAALEAVLRQAADDCHAIVTSGGVSMGDYDVVKAVLGRIAEMHWMQIAIKPAKPFAFGLLHAADGRSVPVFGLPGNPVSSLVSFELLARPALRRMMGSARVERPRIAAVVDEAIRRRPDGKTHFTRVVGSFGDDGRYHVRPVGGQGSHQLAATATATALAVVPDGEGVEVDGVVDVIVLELP